MKWVLGVMVLIGIPWGIWWGLREPSCEALVERLEFVEYEEKPWLVLYGFRINDNWVPKLDEGVGGVGNRTSFATPVKPGGLFFEEAPFKNRFRFIGFEDRNVENPRLKVLEQLNFALFEDRREGKGKAIYEIPNRLPRARRHEYAQHDRAAWFSFKGETVFRVEEGARFSLPPAASSRELLLKEVSLERVVVEWGDEGAVEARTLELKTSS